MSLGESVENRQHGLPRIAKLRTAKPTVAFLSIEPLLENLGKMDLRGIDWVIVGSESGPSAYFAFPSVCEHYSAPPELSAPPA